MDKSVKPSELIKQRARMHTHADSEFGVVYEILMYLDEQHAKKSEECEKSSLVVFYHKVGCDGKTIEFPDKIYCPKCMRTSYKPSPSSYETRSDKKKYCPDCGNTHLHGACGDEWNEKFAIERTKLYESGYEHGKRWVINNPEIFGLSKVVK